jgi:4-hydroxybenzoyl-CoA reductase subunit beta
MLPQHHFVKPATLRDGLMAFGRAGALLMGGGTDVVFNMQNRLLTPEVLISLRDVAELKAITAQPGGGMRLGGACRLTDLIAYRPLAERYPALRDAIRAVASRHVRNMATLAGNLCLDTRCWYTNQSADWRKAKQPCFKTGGTVCHVIQSSDICVALNNADIPPALIALDASVTLTSPAGARDVPMDSFYRPDGIAHTVRLADEILTAVTVPAPRGRAVFLKETPRKGIDFSYGAICAWIDDRDLRLVLGSLSTMPIKLRAAAEIVHAEGLNPKSIERAVTATRDALGALTNLYTPASYKRDIAEVLVRRSLTALLEATP